MRKILGTAILTTVLVAGAAACSDDSSSDGKSSAPKLSAATVKYCGALKKLGDGFGDPGVDAIFEEHPDPTLAEWAAFLPTPVAKIRTFADDVEALEPPADAPTAIGSNVADALAKLREAADLYEGSITAANGGDQAQFDADTKQVQDLAPKIGESMNAAGAACGFDPPKQD